MTKSEISRRRLKTRTSDPPVPAAALAAHENLPSDDVAMEEARVLEEPGSESENGSQQENTKTKESSDTEMEAENHEADSDGDVSDTAMKKQCVPDAHESNDDGEEIEELGEDGEEENENTSETGEVEKCEDDAEESDNSDAAETEKDWHDEPQWLSHVIYKKIKILPLLSHTSREFRNNTFTESDV